MLYVDNQYLKDCEKKIQYDAELLHLTNLDTICTIENDKYDIYSIKDIYLIKTTEPLKIKFDVDDTKYYVVEIAPYLYKIS